MIWHVAQGEELRVVHRQHSTKAQDELLLNISKMAHDFFGRPVFGIGPMGQDLIILTTNRGGELVGRAFQTLKALIEGLL
jgi:hypothetical protein